MCRCWRVDMLSRQIQQIVNSDPDYAAIAPVIEKEILHHDIMDALVRFGAMQSLTHQIKVRTIDNPDYWIYVQSAVKELATQAVNPDSSKPRFDMGG